MGKKVSIISDINKVFNNLPPARPPTLDGKSFKLKPLPNSKGNRAERRAAAKLTRKKK